VEVIATALGRPVGAVYARAKKTRPGYSLEDEWANLVDHFLR
jgi:hypothetical protein